MRFERKFRLEANTLDEILSVVDGLPHTFKTLHPDRQVNNIYLDTPDFSFFHENLSGVGERKKYRLRWYGAHQKMVSDPVMEIKLKYNELGDKESTRLAGSFNPQSRKAVSEFLNTHYFNGEGLEPVLLSAYRRSYLQSSDGVFRLTIDRDMEYASMDTGMGSTFGFQTDDAIVVEIKYDEQFDDQWKLFAESFPFRVTKNSKYVNGVLMTVAQ